MLFGEWLEENVEELNNPNFIKELNEKQKEDVDGLECIILLSGQVKLTEWWLQYKDSQK